jgi:hypothetical protein
MVVVDNAWRKKLGNVQAGTAAPEGGDKSEAAYVQQADGDGGESRPEDLLDARMQHAVLGPLRRPAHF